MKICCNKIKDWFNKLCKPCVKKYNDRKFKVQAENTKAAAKTKKEIEVKPSKDPKEEEVEETFSLFLFSNKKPFRMKVSSIILNKKMEIFIFFCILVNSIILSLSSPNDNPNSPRFYWSGLIDDGLGFLFTFEAIFKIIALGFLFCGPKSYMRDSTNILDFFIVSMCVLEVFMSLFFAKSYLSAFKVVRLSRLIKPIKLIGANRSLKMAI